ncbi:MAG: hypothetical protein ACR2G6_13515 [Gemmatimonadaceae bacterium]
MKRMWSLLIVSSNGVCESRASSEVGCRRTAAAAVTAAGLPRAVKLLKTREMFDLSGVGRAAYRQSR